MFGSFVGNLTAIVYFLLFQYCGYVLACTFLCQEAHSVRLLAGSVFGSVLLQWLPVLFAFVLDFSVYGHIAAACLLVIIVSFLCWKRNPTMMEREAGTISAKYAVLPVAVYCIFAYLVISGFEVRDGAVYSSQATYGDMAMHLGFITSIAQQQVFPPEYSILPGTRLSYPFLSDSISSSLYIWGTDLRLAYMLPMFFAGAQVMYGAWLLFSVWLKEKGKTLLAWVLFFLNGGFGFFYFFNSEETLWESMTRLFTGFYQTPTNLVEENIRWVNVIVDMLLPQRATLFGYAVLFFTLYLLYRAVWQGERRLFILVGVLGGALPMIHTHSFLALVLVSGCWLLVSLAKDCRITHIYGWMKQLLVALIVLMQMLQIVIGMSGKRETDGLLLALGLFAVAYAVAVIWLIVRVIRTDGAKRLLTTWGIYLVVAGVLALPQLIIWTFGQATGDGFLRGCFNWANIDDNYLWFYVKNMGVALLLFLPGFLFAGKKNAAVAFPAIVIWLIAELVVFQPNVYDNNKLLYVAYLLMCGVAADFMVEALVWIRSIPVRTVVATALLCLCTLSGVLTIGRELVAEYRLIEPEQVEVAEFVMEYTDPKDKFLTGSRHNNAIAALTGRNIQCGSGSYLYFHGLDFQEQEAAIQVMYEEPGDYPDIYAYYGVDYILISDYERYQYCVDEATIAQRYPCVYDQDGVRLYQVK